MQTFECRKIQADSPLPEYPTPQFRRDSFLSLNGRWEFCFSPLPNVEEYDREIIVPYAPETSASGIHQNIPANQKLHYRKFFELPEGFRGDRVLLHFEAVDQVCDVYLNGIQIAHHEGGYLPFTVDCLELKRGKNELVVVVEDDVTSPVYPRGKQSPKPGGIWYTPTSGIWGSVWLESVPTQVIQSLEIHPIFDEKKVRIAAKFEGKATFSKVIVSLGGNVVAEAAFDESLTCEIPISPFYPWSPKSPKLYDLEVQINQDKVYSYFGMRKFSVMEKDGHKVFALNNEPLFLTGVLDQGYFPESGLTPPTDKAMADDIEVMKSLGFNCLRKHIKIEPMRWYYHADRLGMIVIQDMVNGGAPYNPFLIVSAPFIPWKKDDTKRMNRFGRGDEASRAFFEQELVGTVERLKNCPCIAIWTLFNEGWGQFEAKRLTAKLRKLDPNRLIDSTSGWFDQGVGDFASRHIYFRKIRLKPSPNRILALTEFGGYSLRVEDHVYSHKNFGYAKTKDEKELTARLEKLYREQVIPAKKQGLSVAILTQLCDVEEETNGLLTYDRKVTKVKAKTMIALNEELKQ